MLVPVSYFLPPPSGAPGLNVPQIKPAGARVCRPAKGALSACFQENVMMVKSCNSGPCPCPHSPTQWTEWSKCSVACGGGEQVREREIVLGVGPSCFKQQDLQMKACNIDECPLPGGTTTTAAATPTPGESVKVSHVTLKPLFRCHDVTGGSKGCERRGV